MLEWIIGFFRGPLKRWMSTFLQPLAPILARRLAAPVPHNLTGGFRRSTMGWFSVIDRKAAAR